MAFFSEFFFSPLINKPVYSLDEKYFGVFRDFIVKRQNESFLITKVRIRTTEGNRIIIPWAEVHAIEADPSIIKLKKNFSDIYSIDYDEDELRLKRDFLDQQIIDTSAHRVVRVNDLKIVAVKDELFMVAADIGFRGLLRRISLEPLFLFLSQITKIPLKNKLIPSKYIDPLPARIRHDITLTVAQEELKNMHPADLADIVENLDQFERISILQTLPAEIMARTVAELDPEVQKQLLGRLKDDTVTKVLERLSPDEATDIMSQLPKRRMQHLLTMMKATDAEDVRQLLGFRKNTAGSLMNTEYVSLRETMTAREALEELQKKGDQAEHIYYLYIVDDTDALKGVISLRDLIFVAPEATLSSLVKRKPITIKINEHVDHVIEKFTKYNLIAMPVIEKKKKLAGVITVDDVLSLLQKE